MLNQTAIVGIPATLVPTDAIAEFSVQQTPSAEFGVKGGAAVNIVMKSGTNLPHGTGYYFRHDDWIDSPNFFDERSAQKLGKDADPTPIKNQQYGGTFGGPIVKDKTFFFGYYEGQRLGVVAPYDVARADRRADRGGARADRRGRPEDESDRREPAQVLPDRSDAALSTSTARPSPT